MSGKFSCDVKLNLPYARTKNLSDASPFFCHFSHSFNACFQLLARIASWIGRIRRSVIEPSVMLVKYIEQGKM